MSAAERAVMIEHVAYWTQLARSGQVLAFGPVAGPAVQSGHGFRTEIAPMPRLVTPDGELGGGS